MRHTTRILLEKLTHGILKTKNGMIEREPTQIYPLFYPEQKAQRSRENWDIHVYAGLNLLDLIMNFCTCKNRDSLSRSDVQQVIVMARLSELRMTFLLLFYYYHEVFELICGGVSFDG